MKAELQQYQVEEPERFWSALPMMGISGYDAAQFATKRRWYVVSSWGRDGWDLGSHPYVIVFFREGETSSAPFDVIEYCEGDVNMWSCPSEQLRNAVTDELFLFHAQMQDASWARDYKTVEELPGYLRGPYRHERTE